MVRRAMVVAVLSLSACENVATVGEPGDPAGPAPAASKRTEPLVSEPFLPSLSPHRLAVAGEIAIVSDPEGPASDGRQPAVHLVSLNPSYVLATLVLPDGSNPGAVEVNPDTGLAYVVARGAGGVYAIDLAARKLGAFTATCPAPIDVTAHQATMVVACMGGEVITVTGDRVTATTTLGKPLTAIAVDSNDAIYAGTAEGEVVPLKGLAVKAAAVPVLDKSRELQPNTVRRLVTGKSASLAMLYQQSLVGELEGPLGNTTMAPPGTPGNPGGGYAGGGLCPVPAARPVLSTYSAGYGVKGSQASTATLAVDLAVSRDGKRVAVADAAGDAIELTPESTVSLPSSNGCGVDQVFGEAGGNGMAGRVRLPVEAPMAVAFAADDRLVVLSGKDALQVKVFSQSALAPVSSVGLRARTLPRGFVLFHTRPAAPEAVPGTASSPRAGTGITCATCHPDGLSNGAVLTQSGTKHRVMRLAGRLANMSAVHWDAKSFSEAVALGTWQKQMGGAPLIATDEAALQAFIGQLRLPPRAEGNAAGRAAFEKAQCGSCHPAASDFTNGGVANVGQGTHKVPSLRGLAYSAPYMSNGCAKTLDERFSIAGCGGGDQHGKPSLLSPDEIGALVGYLRSL